MILVSACLAGKNVKYSGGNNTIPWLCRWIARYPKYFLLACPEVLGGLPVPRLPAEIQRKDAEEGGSSAESFLQHRRVVNNAGEDVTAQFMQGAEQTLELVKKHHITVAILKENSPSCGSSAIYDGTFSGTKVPGQGITAALLAANGVAVYSEKTLTEERLRELTEGELF